MAQFLLMAASILGIYFQLRAQRSLDAVRSDRRLEPSSGSMRRSWSTASQQLVELEGCADRVWPSRRRPERRRLLRSDLGVARRRTTSSGERRVGDARGADQVLVAGCWRRMSSAIATSPHNRRCTHGSRASSSRCGHSAATPKRHSPPRPSPTRCRWRSTSWRRSCVGSRMRGMASFQPVDQAGGERAGGLGPRPSR